MAMTQEELDAVTEAFFTACNQFVAGEGDASKVTTTYRAIPPPRRYNRMADALKHAIEDGADSEQLTKLIEAVNLPAKRTGRKPKSTK